MRMLRSQFFQHVLAALTLAFVLGLLSMIWPAIIAVLLGILLLLQSLSAEPEIAIRSLSEMEHVSVISDVLRQPGLSMIHD